MAGQTIPISTANQMIAEYFAYMSNLGVNMEDQTQSVSFTSNTVMDYLNNVMPNADELRVFMETYPPEHPHAGRTSVILWPFKNGEPALDSNDESFEPFNEGTGTP